MKYKITFSILLLISTATQAKLNMSKVITAAKTAVDGDLKPLCTLIQNATASELAKLDKAQNKNFKAFEQKYLIPVSDACSLLTSRGGGAAAAETPMDRIRHFIDTNVKPHPDWTLTRMLRENGQTQAEFERRGEWPDLQLFYEITRRQAGLPGKPPSPRVAPRRGGGRVSPVAGPARVRPATPPPLMARELQALRDEIEGAIISDANPSDNYERIARTVLRQSALLTGRKPLTTEQHDALVRFGWIVSLKLYITKELTDNPRTTAAELLQGQPLNRQEREHLEEFIEQEKFRLNPPPAYVPPALPTTPPPGSRAPSTRPPLTPPTLDALKHLVRLDVAADPVATLDEILRDQGHSRATLAASDYAQLEATYRTAKEDAALPPAPVDPEPGPGYNPADLPPAPTGLGGDGDLPPMPDPGPAGADDNDEPFPAPPAIPTPPPLPNFGGGDRPGPGGGGGAAPVVRLGGDGLIDADGPKLKKETYLQLQRNMSQLMAAKYESGIPLNFEEIYTMATRGHKLSPADKGKLFEYFQKKEEELSEDDGDDWG